MKVLGVVPTGPKMALPVDFFNVTDFEWGFSQGSDKNANRGTFPNVGIPSGGWPSPYDRLCAEFPKLVWDKDSAYLPNLATFALGAYQRPMVDYLDAETLKDSYQAAYRLLFARRLADILHMDLNISTTAPGSRRYTTQTIIMVPTFVYVVEGMVAFTAAAALVVFLLSIWTKTKLSFEPASIASLMALTGGDSSLVQRMSEDDCATSKVLKASYKDALFVLTRPGLDYGPTICYSEPNDHLSSTTTTSRKPETSKLTLPMELSWAFGLCFICLQTGLVAALIYIYLRIQTDIGKYLMLSRYAYAHDPRSTSAIYVNLRESATGKLSSYGSGGILRANIHHDHKDVVHASTIRAAPTRSREAETIDHTRLHISATTSCGISSS
jgi:hypothetical protein